MRSATEAALARIRQVLAELGLEPKVAKTRIVHLEEGNLGFDFLGFHRQRVRSRGRQTGRGTQVCRIARNTFISRTTASGGSSAARFGKIRDYATLRLAIFAEKRHKRGRRFGLHEVAYRSPDRYGLISKVTRRGTADRETGGRTALGPTVRHHHLACSRPDSSGVNVRACVWPTPVVEVVEDLGSVLAERG